MIPPETREHGYIKDMVNVPSNIEPGEYVLSFRWDCELSSQVWSMCASIFIEWNLTQEVLNDGDCSNLGYYLFITNLMESKYQGNVDYELQCDFDKEYSI